MADEEKVDVEDFLAQHEPTPQIKVGDVVEFQSDKHHYQSKVRFHIVIGIYSDRIMTCQVQSFVPKQHADNQEKARFFKKITTAEILALDHDSYIDCLKTVQRELKKLKVKSEPPYPTIKPELLRQLRDLVCANGNDTPADTIRFGLHPS